MADKSQDTEKRVKIVLTERAPVMVRHTEWPVIACAYGESGDGWQDGDRRQQASLNGELDEWWLYVRRHADGRAIVYGSTTKGMNCNQVEDWEGGEVIPATGDVPNAIARVGRHGAIPERIIRACIADLPPEEL